MCLLVFCTVSALSIPATIYVPDDFPTIQLAVDAAASGATIIVRPGTYYENLTISTKGCTLRSEMGPQTTIIDANGTGGVLSISKTQGSGVTIDGFTIKNAATWYGGIFCGGCNAVLTNNIIIGNHVYPSQAGAGIECNSCPKIVIAGNIIADNKVEIDPLGMGHGGAGIYARNCTNLIVTGNIFRNNTCVDDGAALLIINSDAHIGSNIIVSNICWGWGGNDGYGAGIHFSSGTASITNNTIAGNSALGAAGIYIGNTSATVLTNNTITNNDSHDVAGLICRESEVMIANTVFWDNTSTVHSAYEISI